MNEQVEIFLPVEQSLLLSDLSGRGSSAEDDRLSRRVKGLSVGINLNVDKVCNFDCPYCQVARRTPLTETQQLVKQTGVDVLTVQSEQAHIFSLSSSGGLWSVVPFDTPDHAMRTS